MTRAVKSKDYDIRAAVVTELLRAGIDRGNIRHELTLDTSSQGGRVDLAVLRTGRVAAIEIKSGSDKLDRLKDQLRNYRLAFDAVQVVADIRFKDAGMPWDQCRDTYWCPAARCFVTGWLQQKPIPKPEFADASTWVQEGNTSVVFMARLLWGDEAKLIAQRLGGFTSPHRTRWLALDWMRENARLGEARPLIVEALQGRALNRWEEAFWSRFDTEATGEAAA